MKSDLIRVGTIKNWQVCYRYLVYTLNKSPEDNTDEADFLYIVDLENGNKVTKVRNFALDASGNPHY